ncbi:hypothetical protein DFJ58DRAFT_914320 [Suillus subalutaceus]|uniref:uncharacterized protein n=1 Tax=Suillus subalutaceus TaxID=48586 RepID=UPI001B87CFAF|nr:uncharacterized protein DFJ58DRAFT_914320 [Suillus subalutaceus]KAG1852885.1 hypothetical protein DFJ58DRAFT_914320 [Suillus subalutaceus]
MDTVNSPGIRSSNPSSTFLQNPPHPLCNPCCTSFFSQYLSRAMLMMGDSTNMSESRDTNSHAPKPSVNLKVHYLNHFNITIFKVLSKFDLRRIARVANATPLACISAPTLEEAGYVDILEATEIGRDHVAVLLPARTGAMANHLNDLERTIDDGVYVRRSCELGKRVEAYGSEMRKLAVKRYATSLEVIPQTLAENALGGAEGNEVLSQLWAKHEQKGGKVWGVNVNVKICLPHTPKFAPIDHPLLPMGDSINMVIILAGKLLKKSENFLVMGFHPGEVIRG